MHFMTSVVKDLWDLQQNLCHDAHLGKSSAADHGKGLLAKFGSAQVAHSFLWLPEKQLKVCVQTVPAHCCG